ncbi:MAG: hypothetical protein KDB00_24465 [Planctomycetales bacterium]|nr:hypothetical protein [Planctomycetales bacterium]
MVSSANINAGGAGFKLSLQDELTREIQTAINGAVKTVQSAIGAIDREIKSIGRSVADLGTKIAAVGAGTAALSLGAAFGFAKATMAAGNFAETLNMFDAVFKDQSKEIRAWGETYAQTVGRSREQLLRFLAESQDTFVPLGFDRQEAAELSKTVTKLAIDLGSFKNIDDGEALRSLLGGIIGNTENLRKFGVVAQEAQIKAKALSLGFDPKNLTAYQKAMAILQITIDGTADAQGDAVKTSGSFANTMRALSAEVANLKNAIGGPLLEIATSFVRGVTEAIKAINSILERFPLLVKAAAAAAVAIGAISVAVTGASLAIKLLGGSLVTSGALLVVYTARSVALTEALGGLAAAFKNVGPAAGEATVKISEGIAAMKTGQQGVFSLAAVLRSLGARLAGIGAYIASFFKNNAIRAAISLIGVLFRKAMSVARIAIGGLLRFARFAFVGIARSIAGPIGIITTLTALALKGLEEYYKRAERLANKRGNQLEIERVKIVQQSFIDAGQKPPDDLFKTLDVNNARVVKDPPPEIKALTDAQRELVDEIKAMQTPLETFRDRIAKASELLNRGEINKSQFDAFSRQEFDRYQRNDPVTQARNTLADQLRTPAEELRKSIVDSRRLFADDVEMMGKAIRAAFEQFNATDPARQLAQALMTPAERFRADVAKAQQLLAGNPELIRRAVAAAKERFDAAQPKEKDDPQKTAADQIRESLKSDVQKVVGEIRKALDLVDAGKLSPKDAKAYATKLRKDFLQESLDKINEGDKLRNLATQSAAVAANIGSFAPSFDNTASEEKAYRKKAIDLQTEMRNELKLIREKNPVMT